MNARELFQSGKLTEAVQALNAELRDNPTDIRRRTFLFELLCFTGEWDRAEKQLKVLADENQNTEMGAVLYLSAIHGEKVRHDTFKNRDYPSVPAADRDYAGSLNGKPFEWIVDADPRVGSRLELFAAGAYLWIPFEHVESIEFEKPSKLRDLIWRPAIVRTGAAFKATELGHVLVPVISPFSSQYPNDLVRLGRSTEWKEQEDGTAVPFGQKMFTVDGEDIPILEIQKIEFAHPTEADAESAQAG
jgi:type VI secretion system protein ImpE